MSHKTHNMDSDQYNTYPCEIQKIMATKIHRRSMWRRIKFGHSYQTYNVDICHTNTNMSTTMNIQMWIHARTHKNTPSQPRESNECLITQGICLVFNKVWFYPCDYMSWSRTWYKPLDYQSMMKNVNKCEGYHHWCRWSPRYPSTFLRMWINDLMLNTWLNLSIKGQWCKIMSKVRESIIDECRSQGTTFVSKTNSRIMTWSW